MMQPGSAVSAEAAAMLNPAPAAAAVSVAPQTQAVEPISSSNSGGANDIAGIYRSLEVQDDSKTPYSDATQVRIGENYMVTHHISDLGWPWVDLFWLFYLPDSAWADER